MRSEREREREVEEYCIIHEVISVNNSYMQNLYASMLPYSDIVVIQGYIRMWPNVVINMLHMCVCGRMLRLLTPEIIQSSVEL